MTLTDLSIEIAADADEDCEISVIPGDLAAGRAQVGVYLDAVLSASIARIVADLQVPLSTAEIPSLRLACFVKSQGSNE